MPDKEQPRLLEQRIISNRGLIAWTPDSKYRRFWIQLQLMRTPQINYVSKKFNPDKSDYANITFMRRGMVLREERMQYDVQTFIWDVDVCGYIAKYLQCAIADIQGTLRAISQQLGIPTGTGDELFCEPIQDQFDQIKIVVRIDGAIGVKFYGLRYDINCEEAEQREQPPPPPPDFPNYPPGTNLRDTPTPASPPYNDPDDEGDTSPLPEDEPEPLPEVWQVATLYIQSPSDCSLPRLNLVFYFTGSPAVSNLGAGFCGGNRYSFVNPPPFGMTVDGVYYDAPSEALWGGNSSFDFVDAPTEAEDPR